MAIAVGHQAIIHVPLADLLPAYAVGDMVRAVDEVYVASLWLHRELGTPGEAPRIARYTPAERDALCIHHAEIGTPNFVELIGLTEPILQASSLIGAALGLAKVGVSVRHTLAQTRKVNAEADRINAETAKLILDLRAQPSLSERAERTPASLDPADLAHLSRVDRMLAAIAKKLMRRYAGDPRVILVEAREERVRPAEPHGASGLEDVAVRTGDSGDIQEISVRDSGVKPGTRGL